MVPCSYTKAFEKMRKAIDAAIDRLKRSDPPRGGDTEKTLKRLYAAKKAADEVFS